MLKVVSWKITHRSQPLLIDPHLSAQDHELMLHDGCQFRQGPQTGLEAGLSASDGGLDFQLQPNFNTTSTKLLYRIDLGAYIQSGFPALRVP